jgi:hypothetical protein
MNPKDKMVISRLAEKTRLTFDEAQQVFLEISIFDYVNDETYRERINQLAQTTGLSRPLTQIPEEPRSRY